MHNRHDLHWRLPIVHCDVRWLFFLDIFSHFEGTDIPNCPKDMGEPVVIRCRDGHSSSYKRIAECGTGNDETYQGGSEVGYTFAQKVCDSCLLRVSMHIRMQSSS